MLKVSVKCLTLTLWIWIIFVLLRLFPVMLIDVCNEWSSDSKLESMEADDSLLWHHTHTEQREISMVAMRRDVHTYTHITMNWRSWSAHLSLLFIVCCLHVLKGNTVPYSLWRNSIPTTYHSNEMSTITTSLSTKTFSPGVRKFVHHWSCRSR